MPAVKVSYQWQRDGLKDLLKRFLLNRHFGWRRSANLLAGLLQAVTMPDRAFARPMKLIIEPANRCNLSCPLCPTGRRRSGRGQDMLDMETFRLAVNPLAPYLFEAYLYNWGEPLTNPRLFEMIAHCAGENIRTVLSTNLTLFEPAMLDSLSSSGLDELIVSLDGTSEESYSRYRRGGSFQAVLHNLGSIARAKTERGRQNPWLVWQFIVFQHNQQEMQRAAEMAGEVGVDELRFVSPYSPMEEMPYTAAEQKARDLRDYLPDDQRFDQFRHGSARRPIKPLRCTYLWNQVAVRTDGGVAPCCGAYFQADDFGSLHRDDILKIWNGPRYRQARRAFRSEGSALSGTICDSCIRNLLST